MIGKRVKFNDYKFVYGEETRYVNIYGAFKDKRNANKYVVYSYENNSKLYYGSLFIKNTEAMVMISKDNNDSAIKEFINGVINNNLGNDFEIISLDNVQSIQVIDEVVCDFNVDINKLYDITIPKPEVIKEEVKEKKGISIAWLFFVLLIIVITLFFFVNPEVIHGKNKKYVCTRSYPHNELPINVNDNVNLVFDKNDIITSIDITTLYVFTDTEYYKEFRDRGYLSRYVSGIDSYNNDDNSYTFRLFSSIDTENDYFMEKELDKLISYYENDGYSCKEVEME